MIHDDARQTSQPIVHESDERYCESCGYNLAGLVENRCPECGSEFNPDAVPKARIPWLRRHHSGYASTFAATAWQIMATPSKFARTIRCARRVDLHAADEFRQRCIQFGTGGSAVALLATMLISPDLGSLAGRPERAIQWLLGIITLASGAWLFLTLVNLNPLIPLKNDYVEALNDYAAAPAALFPFILAAIAIGIRFQFFSILLLSVAFPMISWWLQVRLAQLVIKPAYVQLVRAIVLMIIRWVVAAMLALVCMVCVGVLASAIF